MLNWYDLPGALDDFENNPAYLEKLETDSEEEIETEEKFCERKATTCTWFKKRNYKKKMVRRFLSINPDMDYSKSYGMRCSPAIYLCFPSFEEDGFYDPKMTYTFNPYTHIFLSPRGDLWKYHGEAFPIRSSYALGRKDKVTARITNRRIRHLAVDEDISNSYTYLKKSCSPMINRIW